MFIPIGIVICVWFKEQGVLVDEHAHGDARHVEAVEEVLDRHVRLVIQPVCILQLQYSLGQADETEFLFMFA